MAKKLGKNMRLFVKDAAGDTFAQPSGQGNLTIARAPERIDTSSKDTGKHGTAAPGKSMTTITQAFKPDLPDAAYTRLKELDAAEESTVVQIRDKPWADADVVYECEMFVQQGNTDANETEAVGTTFDFLPAEAPTRDLL